MASKPVRLYIPSAVLALALAAQLPAQESKAVLHAPMVSIGIDSAPFQKLGDFDGDGDLDAVGTRHHQNGNESQVFVWRNDNGAFTQVLVIPLNEGLGVTYGSRSLPVEVADLDGNGLDDFVVAFGTTAIRFFAQPGLQFTQQSWALPGALPGPRAMCQGDFDADGTVDIAVLAVSTADHLFAFLGSGGSSSLVLPVALSQLGNNRLGSYELDGVPGDDILLFEQISPVANTFGISNGQIVHQQQVSSTMPSVSATPWLWTGGDIDNDGDTDLVVFKPGLQTLNQAQYQVLRRSGAGTFIAEPQATGGPAEYLRDIDGDGDLDGVCCGGTGGGNYVWPKLDFGSTFEITLNDGTGSFAESWSFSGVGSESLADVADLDGDGDLELVAGRCVFYGNGPWNESPTPWAGGSLSYFQARRIEFSDIDRDGDPDYRGVINQGDGTFVPAPPEPAPSTGSSYFAYPIICDVDGDGARDRIRIQAGQAAGMIWQRNNGGGHFEHAGLIGPIGGLGSTGPLGYDTFFVADFDGDGDEDIYSQGTGNLSWNDNGSFYGAPEVLPVAGNVDGVGDFDGDGILDIAMHHQLAEIVLLGTGTSGSSFAQGWTNTLTVTPPFEPSATVVTDVNGDGMVDILRPYNDAKLHLFVNQTTQVGSPAFAHHVISSSFLNLSYPSPTTSERPSVSVADFDGDGAIDIGFNRVLAQPNTYALLRRLSSDPNVHTYEEINFAIRDGYAADADGDSDIDLIGERTIRNRLYERDAAGYRLQKYSGIAGENGATPVLGGTGPYRAGGAHTLHLTGVPGPTVAIIGLSILEANLVGNPLPGLTLYLDPSWLIVGPWPITENSQGRAAAMSTLALPIFPGTQGWTFYLQAFVPDAAAPSLYTHSNLLALRIGS